MEPLRHGRSCECRGPGRAHRRRGRHRLPDRARPCLWRAARVPHSLLFTDRPAGQNLAPAAARGIAALWDGRRSRMSVMPRVKAPSLAAGLRTEALAISMPGVLTRTNARPRYRHQILTV